MSTGIWVAYRRKSPLCQLSRKRERRPQLQVRQPRQVTPPQHKSLRDYHEISVLSGPPTPPKVEIYLREAFRRHLG